MARPDRGGRAISAGGARGHCRCDRVEQLVHRGLLARPDVQEHPSPALAGPDEGVHDVVDEDEVAGLAPVAEDHALLAVEEAAREDGDDTRLTVGVLARAVDVGERERDEVEPVQGAIRGIVSKAEGRLVAIDPEDRDALRRLVESESRRVLRRRGELLLTETHHGFVCANAGVDLSNVRAGEAALLPVDPDRSARRIRDRLAGRFAVRIGVVISDTFGRTWRNGVTDAAIGVAGVDAAWLVESSVAGGVVRADAEDLFR